MSSPIRQPGGPGTETGGSGPGPGPRGGAVPGGADRTAAVAAIQEHLPELAAAGQRCWRSGAATTAVRAELTETWFPTKEYEDFALPAGEYTALRVVIGEGAGQNWWCVAFPPLCLGAASETVRRQAQADASPMTRPP